MKVLIATKNQGKIEGAKKALEHYFKDVEIIGIPVESDVPDQPVNKEIYNGAKNRVRNLKKYAKENNIEADLFLGIESGINDLLGRWMITNIAVIEDNKDFEMEIREISMDIIDSNCGALFTFAIKNHKLDILDDEIIHYYFETLWDYAGRE